MNKKIFMTLSRNGFLRQERYSEMKSLKFWKIAQLLTSNIVPLLLAIGTCLGAESRPTDPSLVAYWHFACLNPIQPECMEPEKLKMEYGKHLAFWGTIGTQTTMPFGTPEDVRNEVKRRIEVVGKSGGLVLSPTHAIEPEVPWENIIAYFEALEEYGVYK